MQMQANERKVTGFGSLPPEVVVAILLNLDWQNILRLQLVNTVLNDIVKSHTAVQYHVELGVTGMVDGPPFPYAPFTTDERLTRLRLYQARWKHLKQTRVQSVRFAKGAVWELVSGVLAQGVTTEHDELTGASEMRKLSFTKLPVGARASTKTQEWSHENYEFPIRDFTLDPTQDLLVLVRAGQRFDTSAEIHLRSLRTNEKHPAAKRAVVSHRLEGESRRYSHMMQICQDRFCVLHTGLHEVWPEKLAVYNWKTGHLDFAIQFCGIMSFSFLSDRHLLLAVHPFNVMPARQGDQQPRLLILDIDQTAAISPSGHPRSYAAICEFHFPELQQYADVEDILIHSDPAPYMHGRYEKESSDLDGVQQPVAFSIAPQNRVFVITMSVATVYDDAGDHRASEVNHLAIFIPLSTFLPYIMSPRETDLIPANLLDEEFFFGDFENTPRRRIAVEWRDWLCGGARMLRVPSVQRVWVCNVFGGRFVYALQAYDEVVPHAARHVAVLDFNGPAIRRDQASLHREVAGDTQLNINKEREVECEVECADGVQERESRKKLKGGTLIEDVLEPGTLSAESCGIFEEDVTTYLPYRRTVLPEKVRFDGVMLTEDNIIFVNRRAPKEYEVLTF
ncbi:hypothetical protein DFH11DRAFT_1689697 [Phellopilus nigrolimitatus]|nr:hypothetical protein DFH11DRAFT_1689697 [Phellopilus nigrolimitatus]